MKFLKEYREPFATPIRTHHERLVACLHDQDPSIKALALDLLADVFRAAPTVPLVQAIVASLGDNTEYNNCVAGAVQEMVELVNGERKWAFDTLMTVARVAYGDVAERLFGAIVAVVRDSGIEAYVATTLFPELEGGGALVQRVALWVVGEYFTVLSQTVAPQQIVAAAAHAQCDVLEVLATLTKIAAQGDAETRGAVKAAAVQFVEPFDVNTYQAIVEIVTVCDGSLDPSMFAHPPASTAVQQPQQPQHPQQLEEMQPQPAQPAPAKPIDLLAAFMDDTPEQPASEPPLDVLADSGISYVFIRYTLPLFVKNIR